VAEDLKNQPNYCCAAYKTMERAWAIMRDTCAGTLHLRDQGSRYLPMEPAEDTRDFEIRRSRAIFFNAVERTLHGLVGLVFRKEPTLGDDSPGFWCKFLRAGRLSLFSILLMRQVLLPILVGSWPPGR